MRAHYQIPDLPRDRPKVPEVVPLVRAILDAHPAGCCLHVEIGDGNLDTSGLVERAINAEHAECRHVAQLLSRMTPTQRRKVCRISHTAEQADAPWVTS